MGKLRQRAEGRFVCSLNLMQRSEEGTIQLQFSTRKLREGGPSCGNASLVCVCETVKQRIHHLRWCILGLGFPDGTVVKNLPGNAGGKGNVGLTPGSRRSLGGGNGNPLQYLCLENPMDRRAYPAIVHGVTKSWT